MPPRGRPINLSLAGLQIDQIDAETYRRFETNDVRPRWFDATRSIIAGPDQNWLAIAADQPIAPELAALFENVSPVLSSTTIDDRCLYALYRFRDLLRIQEAEQAALRYVQRLGIERQRTVAALNQALGETP